MNSMSPGQRAELEGMMQSLMEETSLQADLNQLAQLLGRLMPRQGIAGRLPVLR